jgi:hypothetical protein
LGCGGFSRRNPKYNKIASAESGIKLQIKNKFISNFACFENLKIFRLKTKKQPDNKLSGCKICFKILIMKLQQFL